MFQSLTNSERPLYRFFHADSAVRRYEKWLQEKFRELDAIGHVINLSGIPERSLKRRFKLATGSLLKD